MKRRAWHAGTLAVLAASTGCAPSPSRAPLGLGPLAVAEQARDAETATAGRGHAAAPRAAARSEPSASAKAAPAETAPDGAGGTVAGDSDDADEPAAGASSEPAFEGLYAGEDVAVFRLTGFPEREQRDDKAKIRIEKASDGKVSITLINSEDGSDLCELLARVEGNTALLESAQPCFSDGSEGSLQAELTSGRAVLEGDRLTMDAEGTLAVSLPDQELDGELTYSFEGERQ
jgi:hypothetical protein